MLSASRWKDRSLPWHALVFWVWLMGFVFSIAASDLFHSPTCPDRLHLQGTQHLKLLTLETSTTPVLSGEIECAACIFQVVVLGVLPILVWSWFSSVAASHWVPVREIRSAFRPLLRSARGPPVFSRL